MQFRMRVSGCHRAGIADMARKIFVFFVLLLSGTFLAWGQTGTAPRLRGGVDGTDAVADELPSVMRRGSSRSSRAADRPPTSEPAASPASAEEDRRAAFVPAAAPEGAEPTSKVDPSSLPTVLRRKPRSSAPNPVATPEGAEESTPVTADPPSALRTETTLPRPFAPAAPAPTAPRVTAPREREPAAPANGLILQAGTPGLRLDASGPRTMRRGVAGKYVISLVSSADLAFEDLEVRILLPNSVALAASEASNGETRRVEESEEKGAIVWSLPRVDARAREQLVLQLVPHQDRGFELGMDWTCRASRQVASVEVQQPQLDVSLSGPKDARYGEALNYLVTVANPGTGAAESVVVKLTAGQNAPESVTVGTIAAGQQKQIEVQLAANQPGELKLVAEAAGEGDLRAEGFAEIRVRRAELQAEVVGPKTQFAGVPVLYQVRVTNAGDAPADDINVTVALPPGARVDSATEGARQSSNTLAWKVASLGANAERIFEVRCELTTTGDNKLEARVAAADGLAVAANTMTTVEALADLKLQVQEPKGPRQVGDELVYEIVVGNRGTKAAEEVNVVMQFAAGIEPLSAEGSPAEVVDGQVVFEPIARLAAGQQVTLKVRAKAEKSGGQRFRAEVQCAASDTQLVSEGTTRVFGGEALSGESGAADSKKVGGRPTTNSRR